MSNQTIEWLRGLAEKGGKGVVNNIDARCLGGIADDLTTLTTLTAERDALDKSHADLARRLADAGRENERLRAAIYKAGVSLSQDMSKMAVENDLRAAYEQTAREKS